MARGGTKADQRPIIIKRVKKVAGGHHGGAWKVAYADFVTAMMAFFMLLWLLTVSDQVVLQGIADYFTPSNATMSNSSGSGSILAGTAISQQNAKQSGSIVQSSAAPNQESESEARQASADKANVAAADWASVTPPKPDAKLLRAEDALKTAIQETPELRPYKDQVIVEATPDGLRIQLIDRDQRPMFRSGEAVLFPFAERMMLRIGQIVEGLPNRISIEGHTDPAGNSGNYGNWELSADRANATRRVLESAKISQDRIAAVVGKAATNPLFPDSPDRPENRRISILLMREAPVVAPDFGRSEVQPKL
jgi:chemotaxis protein MotB